MQSNGDLRHVAGYGMVSLYVDESLLQDDRLSPVDVLVAAYDEQNETVETSDKSCAAFLGITEAEVAASRDKLLSLGDFTVENHRESDLEEGEYYV